MLGKWRCCSKPTTETSLGGCVFVFSIEEGLPSLRQLDARRSERSARWSAESYEESGAMFAAAILDYEERSDQLVIVKVREQVVTDVPNGNEARGSGGDLGHRQVRPGLQRVDGSCSRRWWSAALALADSPGFRPGGRRQSNVGWELAVGHLHRRSPAALDERTQLP